MNKLKRFAETYESQFPTELLMEGNQGVTFTGRYIAHVVPDGKYIVINTQWLNERDAQRLLVWLKDLLEEPTA